jgi:hypothetical protein
MVHGTREGDAEAIEAIEEGICGDLQAKAKCYYCSSDPNHRHTGFAIWGKEK